MSNWNKLYPLETKEYNKKKWIKIKSDPVLHEKYLETETKRRQTKQRQEYNTNWKTENKEHIAKYNAEWKKNNPDYWKQEHIKQKNREHGKIYRKEHPEINLKAQEKYLRKQGSIFNLNSVDYKHTLMSWSKTVRKINNNICQVCNDKAVHSHHIIHRKYYPQLSFNINNGIALCENCHNETHGKKLLSTKVGI